MPRRKSTQELLTEITSQLPDNTSGAITPAVLRSVLNDIVLASQPAYGYLQQSPNLAVTLGLTPLQVSFQTEFESLAGQITATAGATANVSPVYEGTTLFEFTADFEAPNGRFITFTLYKDGAPTTWRVTGNGAGAGNPVAVAFSAIDYSTAPDAVYSIRAAAETNGTNVTLSNMVLLASIQQVNSYV